MPSFQGKLKFVPYWAYRTAESRRIVLSENGDKSAMDVSVAFLRPAIMAQTQSALTKKNGNEILPANSRLILMRDGNRYLGCEVARPAGTASILCFLDQDGDLDFEFWHRASAEHEFMMFALEIKPSSLQPLGASVVYRGNSGWLYEEAMDLRMFLSWQPAAAHPFVEQVGYSFCMTTEDLKTVWGGPRPRSECLTSGKRLKVSEFPSSQTIMGSRIDVSSASSEGAIVEVTPLVAEGVVPFS